MSTRRMMAQRPVLAWVIRALVASIVVLGGLAGWALTSPEATAQEATGSVAITSEPAGARVIVNGRRVGVTPFDLTAAGGTVLVVSIEKDGYQPFEVTVEIAAGASEKVHAAMTPLSDAPSPKQPGE